MNQSLSLQQAFAKLRPVPANAPIAARKELSEAAQVVLAALNRHGKSVFARFGLPADVRDDAVNKILLKMVRKGPAGERDNCPLTDGAATGWLITALRNAAIDEQRRRKARRTDIALDAPAGEHPAGTTHHELIEDTTAESYEGRLRTRQHRHLLERAREFVATCEQALIDKREARRRGTGTDLWETLAQMRQAITGEFDVNAYARSRLQDPKDDKAFTKARNSVDARYKRARAALHDALLADLERARDDWDGDDGQWDDFRKLAWLVFGEQTTLR